MSINNHRTFDDSRNNPNDTANLLDMDSKLSLLSKNAKNKFNNIRNYRYKLHSLIAQKRKLGSNRK